MSIAMKDESNQNRNTTPLPSEFLGFWVFGKLHPKHHGMNFALSGNIGFTSHRFPIISWLEALS